MTALNDTVVLGLVLVVAVSLTAAGAFRLRWWLRVRWGRVELESDIDRASRSRRHRSTDADRDPRT